MRRGEPRSVVGALPVAGATGLTHRRGVPRRSARRGCDHRGAQDAPSRTGAGRLRRRACRAVSRAYIGLGSNLGDRLAYLQSAVDRLDATDGVEVVAVSRV